MGRNVYTEICKGDEVLWNSAEDAEMEVCGRDAETDALFYFITDKEKCEIDLTTKAARDPIIDRMELFKEKSDREYKRIETLIDELTIARRNVNSLQDFYDFTDEIDGYRNKLEDEDWDRAADIINMIALTVDKACTLARIGWYVNGDPDFSEAGVRLVMVWSD